MRKNLLGLKHKANNHYFAFIQHALYVGKQFATAYSLFKLLNATVNVRPITLVMLAILLVRVRFRSLNQHIH